MAPGNIQNEVNSANRRHQTVGDRAELRPDTLNRDASLIKFREWLPIFQSHFYGSNLQTITSGASRLSSSKCWILNSDAMLFPNTPVFTPDPNPNHVLLLAAMTEKYLKKEPPLNSSHAQWLLVKQGDQEDFDCFFLRVLALGKEFEAHTFDETTENIMVLCAGIISVYFCWELRLNSRALTLEIIQELDGDISHTEKEKHDMNALPNGHTHAIQP